MSVRDLLLLSPELSMVGLALLVILLDLAMVNRKGVLAVIATAGLAVPLALGVALWGQVHSGGSEVGIFGTLVVDKFALFFKFLILGATALVFMASVDYVSRFERFKGEYYALILLSATGMMLLGATTELLSIYIALELTALPLAALAAFLGDSRSSEAGIKFLLLSAVSSAVLLYGIAL
ncbi:MAG: proton-conducting transporter membrane subunit, partial [Dehalococcoidia bacterium]